MLNLFNTVPVHVNNTAFSVLFKDMTGDHLLALHKSTMLAAQPADGYKTNEELIAFLPKSKPKQGETIFELCQRLCAEEISHDFRLSKLLKDLDDKSLTIGQVAADTTYVEEHVLLTSHGERVEPNKYAFTYEPFDLIFTAMPMSKYRAVSEKVECAKAAQEKRVSAGPRALTIAATMDIDEPELVVRIAPRIVELVNVPKKNLKRTLDDEPDVLEPVQEEEEEEEEKPQKKKGGRKAQTLGGQWVERHGCIAINRLKNEKKQFSDHGENMFVIVTHKTSRPYVVSFFNDSEYVSPEIDSPSCYVVHLRFADAKSRKAAAEKISDLYNEIGNDSKKFKAMLPLLVVLLIPGLNAAAYQQALQKFETDMFNLTGLKKLKADEEEEEEEEDNGEQPVGMVVENGIFHSSSEDEEEQEENTPSSDYDLQLADPFEPENITLAPRSDDEVQNFDQLNVDLPDLL